MKKSELCALLEKLDLHPSRKLGQNFLIDDNMLDALVRAASPAANEEVLEIGPGTGVLTRRMLAAGAKVTAVELDHRLAAYLREEFSGNPNLTLHEADACKLNYDELLGARSYRCLANLPYSCGSVFLAKLTELINPPTEAFVLLQKEMGDRLTAPIGTKNYGSLTVRLAWLYEISIVRLVPPGVFFPPPEVMSAYIRLKMRSSVPPVSLRRRASALVQATFSQRRKKAATLLEQFANKDAVQTAFNSLSIPADARAETISPAQFLKLAEMLGDKNEL